MIVEVFVAQRDRSNALGEHALLVMNGEDRIPRVRDDGVERLRKSDFLGDIAEYQGAGVRGQPTPQGSRRRRPCSRGWKTEAAAGYSLS